MNKLEYQPGVKGKAIQMDGPVAFVGTAENLRGREWSYELGYRGLTSATRAAREVDVDFFTDYATADALRRAADADVMGRTPGILVAQNEWKQRAYVLSSSPNTIHFGRLNTTLNVALLDGAWWRLASKSFSVDNSSQTVYESATGRSVTTSNAADAPLHALTVYGESVQDGTPTPDAPVPVQTVSRTDGTIGIGVTHDGTETVTPIDLQGHSLASLPDGTRDVLHVENGRAWIEKNVGEIVLDGSETYSRWRTDSIFTGSKASVIAGITAPSAMSDRFVYVGTKSDSNMYHDGEFQFNGTTNDTTTAVTNGNISFRSTETASDKTAASFKAWVAANPIRILYELGETQVIDLGEVSLPTVQDGDTVRIIAEVQPTITAEWQVTPGLDYPHGYPHDYSESATSPDVESSVLTPSDVRIVVYGPAVNPYVIVGGNTYQVNVTVPSGGYLTIDGRDKTIVLTLADGTTRNEFAAGVRGSGLGGGSYIFEPLQPGIQDVTWDGSFGLDFGWYEEEGEPPWSQS